MRMRGIPQLKSMSTMFMLIDMLCSR